MSLGGVGVISVGSNIVPSEICKIVSLCNNNNYNMAREIFYTISSMLESLFVVSNPIPIKYVLCNNKLISNDNLRLPLVKLRNTDSNTMIIDKLSKIKVKNLEIESSFN